MAASLEARRAYARARWTGLADRLGTVTPETVARIVVGVVVLALVGWLAVSSWPALAPFVGGLVLAYAVLPIANRLDRLMPRVAAVLLAELVALAILVGVALLVVPPLLRSLIVVAGLLPTADQVKNGLDNLQNSIGQLQDPVRGIILAVVTQTTTNLQGALDGLVSGAAQIATNQILGLVGTLSFALGLLVIPAWVLTMVADDRHIRRRAASIITPGLRTDVLALARIVDRAFATFLRVQVLLAIVVGVLIWLGLDAGQSLGLGQFRYAVAAATLLGILQLIPQLGFFLGLLPILLVLLVQGPAEALVVVSVYWGATKLANSLVVTRVSRGVLDVHAGLLIPGVVVLSQFGLLWTLAAAPLISVGRDLLRYLNGRLADPPRPAGLLPGDRRARRAAAPIEVPIPTAYRSVAVRPSRASAAAAPAPLASASSTSSSSPVASARAPVAPNRVAATDLPEPAFVPSSLAADLALPPVTERSIAS